MSVPVRSVRFPRSGARHAESHAGSVLSGRASETPDERLNLVLGRLTARQVRASLRRNANATVCPSAAPTSCGAPKQIHRRDPASDGYGDAALTLEAGHFPRVLRRPRQREDCHRSVASRSAAAAVWDATPSDLSVAPTSSQTPCLVSQAGAALPHGPGHACTLGGPDARWRERLRPAAMPARLPQRPCSRQLTGISRLDMESTSTEVH